MDSIKLLPTIDFMTVAMLSEVQWIDITLRQSSIQMSEDFLGTRRSRSAKVK